MTTPSKICESCNSLIDLKEHDERLAWREQRVKDFLDDKLIPYFNTEMDTTMDKVMRVAEGTIAAAKAAPLSASARMAISSLDIVRKYGRTGLAGILLRNEFMESFGTIKALIGDTKGLSLQDSAIGLYYLIAQRRGQRGAEPLKEQERYSECPRVEESLMRDVLKYGALALHIIYQDSVLDV